MLLSKDDYEIFYIFVVLVLLWTFDRVRNTYFFWGYLADFTVVLGEGTEFWKEVGFCCHFELLLLISNFEYHLISTLNVIKISTLRWPTSHHILQKKSNLSNRLIQLPNILQLLELVLLIVWTLVNLTPF